MYKRMLVPLDGSKLAEVALVHTKKLAAMLNLDVTLLHVCEPHEDELTSVHRNYMERAVEIITQQSYDVKPETEALKESQALSIKGELVTGHPAEEILRYSENNAVDLTLLATHGRSGISRWALGSIADKVLRASKTPVLLVRAISTEETVDDQWPVKTIIVPLDGSIFAESVLPHVETLAKQIGDKSVEIVLLSICEPTILPTYYPPDMPLNWNDHMERCMLAEKRYLVQVEKTFKDAGLNVRSHVQSGSPANEIIDYASNNPSNLIIMATHGRSGPRRFILGSVTQNVLMGMSSPLFLVRPGRQKEPGE